ncbi:hypothetical protein AMECASPLE_031065 [Ameca splendens]|uniref:1-phosphatidylinositol 4-kinase n=1 Tax=Ameca splendens TaxID=208324 RepID=A0ABV1A1N3_9TELE
MFRLAGSNTNVLEWPSQSPDLNLWREFKIRVMDLGLITKEKPSKEKAAQKLLSIFPQIIGRPGWEILRSLNPMFCGIYLNNDEVIIKKVFKSPLQFFWQ